MRSSAADPGKKPRRLALAAGAALCLATLTSGARADGEAWQQFEYRLPIVRTPRPEFPRLAARVYAEAREAGRFDGLYDSFLRVGPLLWVSRFLFIGAHGTFQGTRTAGGCAQPAPAGCGQYVFEFRGEIEPNFFGRLGPITFNDRNRLEYRWRETGARGRYRNQLRINYQPADWTIYPFVIDEILFDLKSEGFNQNRATAGVAFALSPSTRLDLGYTFRSRLTVATAAAAERWDHDHIALVMLVVDVPALEAPRQAPAPPTRLP